MSRKTGLNLSVSAPSQFLAASTGDRPEQKQRTYAIGQSRESGLTLRLSPLSWQPPRAICGTSRETGLTLLMSPPSWKAPRAI